MVAAHRPDLIWQAAFNAEPNDPGAVPLWTDLTAMVKSISAHRRGRVYEMASTFPQTPTITFRDPDEYLNPQNTSSPYAPQVQPYRPILGQAVWPNPYVSGEVNFINTGRWKPNDEVASDPSFESYTNGAVAPNWLTAVGAVSPTITTTNPQQGTKSVTYAVAATAVRQGLSWRADTVPGRQYTTSVYVRQSSASTQWLLVGGQVLAWDDFETAASNGWGTAPTGGAWSTVNGSASDYSVSGGTGRHSIATLAVRRLTLIGSDIADSSQRVTITWPEVVTGLGQGGRAGLTARYIDANNYYLASVVYNLDGSLEARLTGTVGGVQTLALTEDLGFRYETNTQLQMRMEVESDNLRLRVWPAGETEPTIWQLEGTDTGLSHGQIGCQTYLDTGATNTLPLTVQFEDYTATGSNGSTTTTTTGSYVRLSKTFTATEDRHTITIATRGTAVAGTVNIDAVQHEEGASATTFTTAGPVIYPLLRQFGERWTRTYSASGYVGYAPVPAVDAFAALAATDIPVEYVTAVNSLRPDFFWSLGGGTSSQLALESTGTSTTPLALVESKFGAGTAPAFGAAIEVPGLGGSPTGVKFEQGNPVNPQAAEGTILGAGRVVGGAPVNFPLSTAVYGSTDIWNMTAALWVTLEPSPTYGAQLLNFYTFDGPIDQVITPISVAYNNNGGAYDVNVTIANGSDAHVVTATSAPGLNDGQPHLIVVTAYWDIVIGFAAVSIWIDGVAWVTNSGDNVAAPSRNADSVCIGGVAYSSIFSAPHDGVISMVSVWNRQLVNPEIEKLWEAGQGYAGELTGVRLARHLENGNYAGRTRISDGSTTLQPATFSGTTSLLADGQQITGAEQGNLWVAPDGAYTFEGRQDRWLRLEPVAVLGEDEPGGEYPYLGGIIIDDDPNFVYADVRITRLGGALAFGGTRRDIDTAKRRYFGKSFAAGYDFETDEQAQYAADYIFNTHRAPIPRISKVTLDPSANPALWPVALSLEVGQRITVVRRAKAANAGAGLTMEADYFVESVEHSPVSMAEGTWNVSFYASPVGSVDTGNGVTLQPWILENATYGVLDSTTVLGW